MKKNLWVSVLIVVIFIGGLVFVSKKSIPVISCEEIKADLQKELGITFKQNPNSVEYMKSGRQEGDLYCSVYAEFDKDDSFFINKMTGPYFGRNGWDISKSSYGPLDSSSTDWKKGNVWANVVISWNDYELCIDVPLDECAQGLDKSKLKYQIDISLIKQSGPIEYID